MALNDLLVGMMALPSILASSLERWPFGQTFCKINGYLFGTSYKQRSRSTAESNKPEDAKRGFLDNKAIRTFLIITVTFTACWLPVTVARTLQASRAISLPAWIDFLVSWLSVANSFCNVFIYFFFNRSFKLAAKKMLAERFGCCQTSVMPVLT
ncbi:5-hydroxytryptamine receptor 1A-alpha-like [Strongylocentrotus purpuratus]|uniref:G-protein coupled receptors family 1 profile domain-containing protein n=1 Tax=Strongylocentrotus purpuratus TaxID=7668 RepID=A0A7M7NQ24_STRPU|nr:5-hydroxytryptamine receptor 1A-alpha-like [Strongylocentrotus purpuratus]